MTAAPTQNKPVIFLAFANDLASDGHYLRQLSEEARRLRTTLERGTEQGSHAAPYNVVVRQNATIEDLFDAFRAHRDRIVLFHFGGHANGYELYFENAQGQPTAARAEGLAAFLGRQRGLRLVFLNGCSSRAQAQKLLAANMDVVIATECDVEDTVALHFADHFYRGLVSGAPLETAFHEAVAAAQVVAGSNHGRRHLRPQDTNETALNSGGWPWELYVRPGDEAKLQWKLVDALPADHTQSAPPTVPPPSLPIVPNPYRGLEPFEATHAANYFGRAAMVDKLLTKLQTTNFVAVVGPSGSGKSSLVRAGLLTALSEGRLPGSQNWQIAIIRPGDDPLRALATPLVNQIGPALQPVERLKQVREMADGLQDGSLPIGDVLAEVRTLHPGLPRLLLIFDQFEETFTLCSDEVLRRAFLQTLLAAANTPWLTILFTLRADFYGRVLADEPLGKRVDAGLVNVLPMTAAERRAAIEQPILNAGRRFEEGLVQRIFDDVESEPGELSLLEFALTELWEYQTADGLLTHASYEKIGKVAGAITRRAEAVYQKLKQTEQAQLPLLFTQLIHVAHSNEGGEDTRQRIRISDIPKTLQWIAEQMTRSEIRLLVTGWDPVNGEATVEVAHEALIRYWERLRDWLDMDRTFLIWRQRYQADVERWLSSNHSDPDTLLRGSLLADAEKIYAEHPNGWNADQIDYLIASLMQRTAEETNYQQQLNELYHARIIAEKALRLATARELASYAITELDRFEDVSGSLALLLARQSVLTTWEPDKTVTIEAQDALQRTVETVSPWQLTLLEKHDSFPLMLAVFSPNDELIATASEDCKAHIWKVSTGQKFQQLEGHLGEVRAVAFSPDCKLVVTASTDNTARIWDVNSGRELCQLIGHKAAIWDASFSPDGRLIVTASEDCTVRIWEVASMRKIRLLRGHTGAVLSARFSPDMKFIVTASKDKTVRIWKISHSWEIRRLSGHTDIISSANFSADGKSVITASIDGTVCIWNIASKQLMRQFGDQKIPLWYATYSHDDKLIATANNDGTAQIWKITDGQKLLQLRGHEATVSSVSFSSDSKLVVTASDDGTARIWKTIGYSMLHHLQGHINGVRSATFSPDGKLIITGSIDGTVGIWEFASGRKIHQLFGHQAGILSTSFSPDGKFIVTAGIDRTARIWEIPSFQEVHQLHGHKAGVLSAAFSPDSKVVVTVSNDGIVRIWKVANGQEMYHFSGKAAILSVAFSSDGKFIATAGDDHMARIWEVTSFKEVYQMRGHTDWVRSVAFSPDNYLLVTASNDHTVRLWEVASSREILQFEGHTNWVTSATFSPNGQLVVTASIDRTSRLWEVSSGQAIRQFQGHKAAIWNAAFSPNGKFVITASDDCTARIWLTSLEDLLMLSESLIQRIPPILTTEERWRFLHEK